MMSQTATPNTKILITTPTTKTPSKTALTTLFKQQYRPEYHLSDIESNLEGVKNLNTEAVHASRRKHLYPRDRTITEIIFENREVNNCDNNILKWEKISSSVIDKKSIYIRQKNSCEDVCGDVESPMTSPNTDVESFEGQIVYNLDGSAFMIDDITSKSYGNEGDKIDDDKEAYETDTNYDAASGSTIPGIILSKKLYRNLPEVWLNPDSKNLCTTSNANGKFDSLSANSKSAIKPSAKPIFSQAPTIPTASAPEISSSSTQKKSTSTSLSLTSTSSSVAQSIAGATSTSTLAPNPRIHSFRVVTAHDADATINSSCRNAYIRTYTIKIQKPILMCFLCKLSFGTTKSFHMHAQSEHQLQLGILEEKLLQPELTSSAIIQRHNMNEKAQISFLEPLEENITTNHITNHQQQHADAMAESEEVPAEVKKRNSNKGSKMEKQHEYIKAVATKHEGLESESSALHAKAEAEIELEPCESPENLVKPPSQKSGGGSDITDSNTDSDHRTTRTIRTSRCSSNSTENELEVMLDNEGSTELSASRTTFPNESNEDNEVRDDENGRSESVYEDQTDTPDLSGEASEKPFHEQEKQLQLLNLGSLYNETTKTNINNNTSSDNSTRKGKATTNTATTIATAAIDSSRNVEETGSTDILSSHKSSTNSSTNIYKSEIKHQQQKDQLTVATTPTLSICSEKDGDMGGVCSFQDSRTTTPTSVASTAAVSSFLQKQLLHPSQFTSSSSSPLTNVPTEFAILQQMQLQQQQLMFPTPVSLLPASSPPPSVAQAAAAAAAAQLSLAAAAVAAAQGNCPSQIQHTHPDNTQHNQFISLRATLAAAICNTTTVGGENNNEHATNNSNNAKLITEFLQNHLAMQQQQQKQLQKFVPMVKYCPDHPDFKGVDCKSCELLDVQIQLNQQLLPTQQMYNHQPQLSQGTLMPIANSTSTGSVNSTNATSFTIGACSDHINGRPLGVDCSRCEMILNSARLNSGTQMSTRNSCKTLKCPQCNWHYKYQETLEIHMREKHPDGESACGYCLAGQQHPRLARGESYSCGYKPYRCEICNYSTTTKGNLSIHMQSDKHLNNMQELNSTQNIAAAAAAAVAAAAVGNMEVSSGTAATPTTTKLLATSSTTGGSDRDAQQKDRDRERDREIETLNSFSGSCNNITVNNSGISNIGSVVNKLKPTFRCDICNYETSVARNLRIHMTSEKHTHNMAVLQNNIKHMQAFNYLQQQHQQATAAATATLSVTQFESGTPSVNPGAPSSAVSDAGSTTCGSVAGKNTTLSITDDNNTLFLPEVALADLAYNQALIIQLLQQNGAAAMAAVMQNRDSEHSRIEKKGMVTLSPNVAAATSATTPTTATNLAKELGTTGPRSNELSLFGRSMPRTTTSTTVTAAITTAQMSSADGLEPNFKPDLHPTALYSCLVCAVFNTNNLDELNQHILIDRSRQISTDGSISSNSNVSNNNEVMLVHNNNYICRLCNYKTNLKANFQLHCKTDKHLQKLNFINHIREGGPQNEYKLKYQKHILTASSGGNCNALTTNNVQLKCNCCDFYTNTIQKLSLHAQHMRHETMRGIFQHLLLLIKSNRRDIETQYNNYCENKDQESKNKLSVAHYHTINSTSTTTLESNNTESSTNIFGNEIKNAKSQKEYGSDKDTEAVVAIVKIMCQLCNYVANSLLDMIQHVKSIRHLQIEQFVCLQRRSEDQDMLILDDVFKICHDHNSFQSTQLFSGDSSVPTIAPALSHIEGLPLRTDLLSPSSHITTYDDIVSTSCEGPVLDHAAYSPASSSSIHSLPGSKQKRDATPHQKQSSTATEINGENEEIIQAACADEMPTIIYKCCHCDYYSKTKTDINYHLEQVHPHASDLDFITIPTNTVAIQAFQAAVAAATAAAAAVAVNATRCNSRNSNASSNHIAKSPTAILCERQQSFTVSSKKETFNPMAEPNEQCAEENADIEDDDSSSTPIKQEHLDALEIEKDEEYYPTAKSDTDKPTACGSSNKHDILCPLCQESFTEKPALELHLMHVHSVNHDGLSRLLQLVDTRTWGNSVNASKQQPTTSNASCPTTTGVSMPNAIVDTISCLQCDCSFNHEQQLLQHAQKLQHYTMTVNGEFVCLAASAALMNQGESSDNLIGCQLQFPNVSTMLAHYKDVHISSIISERHVYKYRCKQCSLAFKTQDKLSMHTIYHTMRDATKCMACQRNFRSTQALQKHIDQMHCNDLDNDTKLNQPQKESLKHQMHKSLCDTSDVGSTELPILAGESDTEKTGEASPSRFPQRNAQSSPSLKEIKKINEEMEVHKQYCQQQLQEQKQQQNIAAITAALLKKQKSNHQQHQEYSDIESSHYSAANGQHLHLEQKYLQQQQHSFLSPSNTSQGVHSVQQMQQLPQLAAAVSDSGLTMNAIDMLNLMQFHHLISLNFMNLAPPLIFGGVSTNTGSKGNGNTTSSNTATSSLASSTAPDLLEKMCITLPQSSNTNAALLMHQTTQVAVGNAVAQQQMLPSPTIGNTGVTPPIVTTMSQLSNQKRARTRITDDQLKILRAHFDINNSPSEESIMDMSQKANLPMKVSKTSEESDITVVKHWFRNTLFKERQRNKDSPYNFNNPPSTTLNLEEYERTGQAKVTTLGEPISTALAIASAGISDSHKQQSSAINISGSDNAAIDGSTISSASDIFSNRQRQSEKLDCNNSSSGTNNVHTCLLDAQVKIEPNDNCNTAGQAQRQALTPTSALLLKQQQQRLSATVSEDSHQLHNTNSATAAYASYNSYETKSESGSSDNMLSRPPTPTSTNAIMNSYTSAAATVTCSSNMNELVQQYAVEQQQQATIQNPHLEYHHQHSMGPPKKFQIGSNNSICSAMASIQSGGNITVGSSSNCNLISGNTSSTGNTIAKAISHSSAPTTSITLPSTLTSASTASFNTLTPAATQYHDNNSNSSSNSSSTSASGKRANRTRFTDYQIKVLQEFFENNSYPKDSDLEYLSKLLLLSPRVIVVWFQNARQKQRKIYENQPNNSLYETEEKKQNINYTCKKCNLVFQRYYELIRHQKNHCFKEENNKKSAKAQIAAAQIAQNLSSEDSNSSQDIHSNSVAAAAVAANIQHNAAVTAAAMTNSGCASDSVSSGNQSMSDFDSSITTPSILSCEQNCESLPQNQGKTLTANKHDCEKCKLTFQNQEHLREHQLLHIMNPNLFTTASKSTTVGTHATSQRQQHSSTVSDTYGSFSSILQNFQHVSAQQQQQHGQCLFPNQQGLTNLQFGRKRKFSETSSNADDNSLLTSIGNDLDSAGNYISTSDHEFLLAPHKRYELLYQYFLHNESNAELRQQFQCRQQEYSKQHHGGVSDADMDFLWNYYQKTEQKKSASYDFLYQYYLKNEPCHLVSSEKPQMDFLQQYYQMHKSEEFFQLQASPHRTRDSKNTTTGIESLIANREKCDSETVTTKKQPKFKPDLNKDGSEVELRRSKRKCRLSLLQQKHYERNDDDDNSGNSENHMPNDVSDSNSTYNQYFSQEDLEQCTDYTPNTNRLKEKLKQQHLLHSHRSSKHIDDDMNNKNQELRQLESKSVEQEKADRSFGEPDDQSRPVEETAIDDIYNEQYNIDKSMNIQKPSLFHYHQQIMSSMKQHSVSSGDTTGPHLPDHYFENLEEFLDATMIEHSAQSLAFNNDIIPATTKTIDKTIACAAQSAASNPMVNEKTSDKQQQHKRLRTTILPEQLNFLYECYQNESNPSRKMLEEIAKKVNLKKRVVQVWFQNSRAKDKKSRSQRFGQKPATQQQRHSDFNDDMMVQLDHDTTNTVSHTATRKTYTTSHECDLLEKAIPCNSSDSNSNYACNSINNNNNCNTSSDNGHTFSTQSLNTSGEYEKDMRELQECKVCELSQVNIKQHVFTLGHMMKVKDILTIAATPSTATDINSDDNNVLKHFQGTIDLMRATSCLARNKRKIRKYQEAGQKSQGSKRSKLRLTSKNINDENIQQLRQEDQSCFDKNNGTGSIDYTDDSDCDEEFDNILCVDRKAVNYDDKNGALCAERSKATKMLILKTLQKRKQFAITKRQSERQKSAKLQLNVANGDNADCEAFEGSIDIANKKRRENTAKQNTDDSVQNKDGTEIKSTVYKAN